MKKKDKERLAKLEVKRSNIIRLKHRSWTMYSKYSQRQNKIDLLISKLSGK